jgi:hypothetical protein
VFFISFNSAPHDIRAADRSVIGGASRLLVKNRRPCSMRVRVRAARSMDPLTRCDSRFAWCMVTLGARALAHNHTPVGTVVIRED